MLYKIEVIEKRTLKTTKEFSPLRLRVAESIARKLNRGLNHNLYFVSLKKWEGISDAL